MKQTNFAEEEYEEMYEEYTGEEDEFICGCRAKVIDEQTKSDTIRDIVMRGMSIYDEETIRDVLRFLSMYPSYHTVYEVVSDIAAYYDEVEND